MIIGIKKMQCGAAAGYKMFGAQDFCFASSLTAMGILWRFEATFPAVFKYIGGFSQRFSNYDFGHARQMSFDLPEINLKMIARAHQWLDL